MLGNDAEKGYMFHGSIKATSKNIVYKVTAIPTWVKAIKLYPKTGTFCFAINEDPTMGVDLVPASGTKIVPFSGFSVGGVAVSGMWEVRLVGFPASPELRYMSDTDNASAFLEFCVR
jgi:hypothetical protein